MDTKIVALLEEISKLEDKKELITIYKRLQNQIETLLNEEKEETTPRRNTLETENKILETKGEFKPLEAQYEPIFTREIENFIFMNPTKEMQEKFSHALSSTVRFDTNIRILEKAVLLEKFISISSCNSLMNVFLQVGDSHTKESNNVLESISELINVWGGQALSFRLSKSNVMVPHESDTPSEIAFYKLERKHLIFKTLAEELGAVFNSFYNTPEAQTELFSVSLSLRYLVPNQGGNPIHIDAWKDSMLEDGYIYTNQQFSLFLSANEEEEFVVFGEDGTKTIQKGNGSLMGFNPTQKHHHPDGHGSWILIIEVILKIKI